MFVFYGQSISELNRVDDQDSPLTLNDLLVVSQMINGVETVQALTIQQLKDKLLLEIDQSTAGATGATGPIGNTGATGEKGSQGNPGVSGAQGPSGATGAQGESGATGARGATGEIGSTGATGAQGSTGLQGATGVAGQDGDRYQTTSSTTLTVGDGVAGKQTLTVETGLSYTPNQSVTISLVSNVNAHMHGNVFSYDNATGVLVVSIVSHSGTGTSGSLWTVNLAGAVGAVGATGAIGLTGATGAIGLTGATGAIGLTGATGPAGEGASLEVVPNSGISIVSNQISTIYNTAIADMVASIAVGGASSAQASAWKQKTLVEALDSILFPDQLPTYTIPTLTFTGTQSGTLEVGTSINQNLSLTAKENDAGAFTYLSINRAGSSIYNSNSVSGTTTTAIADQYGYANPNTPNLQYVLTYLDVTGTVPSGSLSWTGTANYSAGLAKKNNKGVDDTRSFSVRSVNNPQAASTGFESSTITVTGIYPYFWGKSSSEPSAASIASAIEANQANKVLSAASGDVTVTFNASGEYVWIAIHENYSLKTTWYNTGLNNGNIGSGQFILSPVQYSVNSPSSLWTGQTYNIYISSGATSTEGSLKFQQ